METYVYGRHSEAGLVTIPLDEATTYGPATKVGTVAGRPIGFGPVVSFRT